MLSLGVCLYYMELELSEFVLPYHMELESFAEMRVIDVELSHTKSHGLG
jgi:hypothetical protein